MFNISSFLKKISDNIGNTEIEKEKILEIIKKESFLEFKKEDFEIKNYIVYFENLSPAVKNKIFIYKDNILKELKKFNIKIVDIR